MSMIVLTQVTLISGIVKSHDNFDNMHDLCYVSVNSKPDHPPSGKTLQAIFLMGEFPTPWAKKEFKTPTPRAYKNELKPHLRGHFPQLFAIKT